MAFRKFMLVYNTIVLTTFSNLLAKILPKILYRPTEFIGLKSFESFPPHSIRISKKSSVKTISKDLNSTQHTQHVLFDNIPTILWKMYSETIRPRTLFLHKLSRADFISSSGKGISNPMESTQSKDLRAIPSRGGLCSWGPVSAWLWSILDTSSHCY